MSLPFFLNFISFYEYRILMDARYDHLLCSQTALTKKTFIQNSIIKDVKNKVL